MAVQAATNELFSVFEEFGSVFREVTDLWMTACYESCFTEFNSFSQLVELSIMTEVDISSSLIRLCGVLLQYEQIASEDEEIWGRLAEMDMKAQKLVVFLWYLIERGLVGESALEEQKVGLGAASTLLALCSLSGSQAFNIFDFVLYQKALDTLRGAYRLLMLNCSGGDNNYGRKNNPKRKRNFDSSIAQHSTAAAVSVNLTESDKREIRESLFDALDSFFVFLNKVSLSMSREARLNTACLVRDLMRIDFADDVSISAKECRRLSEFQSLRRFSERSFALMHRLSEKRHAGVELVMPRIVMPRLLFWTFDNTPVPTGAHPTKLMSDYKDAMIRFLRIRIQKGNEEEMNVILRVLENICPRCPDRTEYRVKVAPTVCEALTLMPIKYHYDFAHFIRIFGSNGRCAWRAIAVEIIPLLLQNFDLSGPDPALQKGADEVEREMRGHSKENENGANEKADKEDGKSGGEKDSEDERNEGGTHEKKKRKRGKKKRAAGLPAVERLDPMVALFTLILRYCDDKSSTVRARAIMQLITLLENEQTRLLLSRISAEMAALKVNGQEIDEGAIALRPGQFTDSPLLNILLSRCNDPRVSARKAAILALEAFFWCLADKNHITHTINMIKRGCRDASLLMRKQSAESLTRLLTSASDHADLAPCLENAWLTSVMPLVVDREQSVSQLASKLIIETLISPILSNGDAVAWRLLAAIEKELDLRRSILRALLCEAKEGKISERVVDVLLKKCDQPDKASVIDPSRAARVWFSLAVEEPGDVISYVAHVIGLGAERLSSIDKQRLRKDLSAKLHDYKVDVRHVSKVYWAFSRLYNREEEGSEADEFSAFNKQLMKDCHTAVHSVLYSSERNSLSPQNPEEVSRQLVRILTLIGEIVQYDPSLITDSLCEMVQIIIASDYIGRQLSKIESRRQTPMPTRIDLPNENAFANDAEGGSQPVVVNPQGKLAPSSQGTTQQTAGPSQRTAQTLTDPAFVQSYVANPEVFNSSVRAHAVLTIGKICLVDDVLAKKCVPVLVKQLVDNPDHCIRNNIVAIVCDLCMRYTSLIDSYSGIIALSMRDRSTLVRKQAITLLTCLIKEQYIRWQGQIMYRFVSTLLDEDEGIREYSKICLLDVLLMQNPKMFEHHFVECMFYFNSVEEGAWAIINSAEDETAGIKKKVTCLLTGEDRREDRMKLYKFMLKTFNDESRFVLMERIAYEVFAAVAEGSLDLKKSTVQSLLVDCYEVMRCEEIKLTMALGQRSSKAAEEDDDEPPAAVQAGAKKVISQLFRKGMIETILPHIIQLRYYVQNIGVPDRFERGILLVLRDLCKDHQEQLDEFMASDPLLREEIRFDLKKLEAKERAEAEARQRMLLSVARSARRSLVRSAARCFSDTEVIRRVSLPHTKESNQMSTPAGVSRLSKADHAVSVDRAARSVLAQRMAGAVGNVGSGLHKGVRNSLLPVVLRPKLPSLEEERREPTLKPIRASTESRPAGDAAEASTSSHQVVPEQVREQDGVQRMESISEGSVFSLLTSEACIRSKGAPVVLNDFSDEEMEINRVCEVVAGTVQSSKTIDYSKEFDSAVIRQKTSIKASSPDSVGKADKRARKKQSDSGKVVDASIEQEEACKVPLHGEREILAGNYESPLGTEAETPVKECAAPSNSGERKSVKRPPIIYPPKANEPLTPVSASHLKVKKGKMLVRSTSAATAVNHKLRAISTPNHSVSELTFRADVSAILKSPPRRQQQRRMGKHVVETIEEHVD
ncbi:Condensin-2 complex subunit D3 [Toxocara canis]|uniref:Condensin-2 complex subunit D3 n=1 Tax=Toxocara canis TaxID=6265 RepID=A0A0B2VFW2_TOXCA|nr:Condensin-2 complex subunit D3 [Toxocara canis]